MRTVEYVRKVLLLHNLNELKELKQCSCLSYVQSGPYIPPKTPKTKRHAPDDMLLATHMPIPLANVPVSIPCSVAPVRPDQPTPSQNPKPQPTLPKQLTPSQTQSIQAQTSSTSLPLDNS